MSERTARPPTGRGLAARIAFLAAAVGLLGALLIFVPSISGFRIAYLEERVAAARLAILALDAAPDRIVPIKLEATLLNAARARAITIWRPDAELMLGHMGPVDGIFDLRDRDPLELMAEAIRLLFDSTPGVVRVIAPAPDETDAILDVALDQTPLRDEMLAYSERIAILSLVLAAMVGMLLMLSLQRMIVRPLAAITRRMDRFREQPQDPSADPPRSARPDEIGIVERELGRMQAALRQALAQKTRLAALGATMSQLTHDLKNMLATAVLISDRLERSDDPAVRRVAPRLIASLDRAIRLCVDTLGFAREQPRPPVIETFHLRPLIDEVAAAVGDDEDERVIANEVLHDLVVMADRDQLYRVLLNLFRNGLESTQGAVLVRCTAVAHARQVEIEVADNGPGVPEAIQPRLFEAFGASGKTGGSGLGLAICREIMRAHGGDIVLAGTGSAGSRFILTLPERSAGSAELVTEIAS